MKYSHIVGFPKGFQRIFVTGRYFKSMVVHIKQETGQHIR